MIFARKLKEIESYSITNNKINHSRDMKAEAGYVTMAFKIITRSCVYDDLKDSSPKTIKLGSCQDISIYYRLLFNLTRFYHKINLFHFCRQEFE